LPTAIVYYLYRPAAAISVCEKIELRKVKVTCLHMSRRGICHGCLLACLRALQVQRCRATLDIEYTRHAHTYSCIVARAGLAQGRRAMRPRSALRYRSPKTKKCQLVFLVAPGMLLVSSSLSSVPSESMLSPVNAMRPYPPVQQSCSLA
jgi:hypothetical protein